MGYSSLETIVSVGGGIAILIGWVFYERRPAEPLIDIDLLKLHAVAKTMAASGFVQFVLVSRSMLISMFVMPDPDLGFELGTASATLPNLMMRTVPAETQGIAGGMLNLSGSMGSALGSQLMIAIRAVPGVMLVGHASQYQESGYVYVFLTLSVIGAAAAAMGVLLTRAKAVDAEPSKDSVSVGH
ncbi:hypothetical protein [Rhodococcus sp. IEGM 1379]|uniref:hypothetical protein n=1 Tax=Rhodococcus sp. IEGM 1379 TaxID=3047086 RepID=UPI0024B6C1A9|nr:hypothetical protein [Rhodococcus sp. IEGM 1379]MDI9919165.1 hypothetical protein [Rhodococcus sp. IEGM 1379]